MSSLPSNDPHRPTIPWPYAGWLGPVAYCYLGYLWWQVSIEQLKGAALAGSGLPLPVAGALALGSRLAGWLLECLYYAAWWRWRGRGLPFWRFYHWIAALSTVDLLAEAIRHGAAAGRLASIARAWLLGPGFAAGPDASIWVAAFGGAGILTLLRLGLVVRIQQQALALPWKSPALVVAVTWVAGRLVLAWARDLLSGPSLR
jgi:hypothetical protein